MTERNSFLFNLLIPILLGASLAILPACQKAKFNRKQVDTKQRPQPQADRDGQDFIPAGNSNTEEEQVTEEQEDPKDPIVIVRTRPPRGSQEDDEHVVTRPRPVAPGLYTIGTPGPQIDSLDHCHINQPQLIDCGPVYIPRPVLPANQPGSTTRTTVVQVTEAPPNIPPIIEFPCQTCGPVAPTPPPAVTPPATDQNIQINFQEMVSEHVRVSHLNIYLVIDASESFKDQRHAASMKINQFLNQIPEWVSFNVVLVAGTAGDGAGSIFASNCDPNKPANDCQPNQSKSPVALVHSSGDYKSTAEAKQKIANILIPEIHAMDNLRTSPAASKGRMGLYSMQSLLKKQDILRNLGLISEYSGNAVLFLSNSTDLCVKGASVASNAEAKTKAKYCPSIDFRVVQNLLRHGLAATSPVFTFLINKNYGPEMRKTGKLIAKGFRRQRVNNKFVIQNSEPVDINSIRFTVENENRHRPCKFDAATNAVYVDNAGEHEQMYTLQWTTLRESQSRLRKSAERGCDVFRADQVVKAKDLDTVTVPEGLK